MNKIIVTEKVERISHLIDKNYEGFTLLNEGINYCEVCSDLPLEELLLRVNLLMPTGMKSKWKKSKKLSTHSCKKSDANTHYILEL